MWISIKRILIFLFVLIFLSACAIVPGTDHAFSRPGYDRETGTFPDEVKSQEKGYTETGSISYYAEKFHGKKTASGEKFDKNAFTAAHRTLPFHTKIKVTNLDNGKSVTVEVNDRGPFSSDRILDISPAAARKINLISSGTAHASISVE